MLMFAVMAVDPGGVTGCARGVFNWQGSVKETIQAYAGGGRGDGGQLGWEAWEVEGDPRIQAWEIASEFHDWATPLLGAGGWHVTLVFEDFKLRTGLADLSPVEVIAGTRTLLVPRSMGLEGRLGPAGWALEFQSAADAKQYATSPRMREWGVWSLTRGSNHKRDAIRHLCLRVSRIGRLIESGGAGGLDD
jgi:hypothetical protein